MKLKYLDSSNSKHTTIGSYENPSFIGEQRKTQSNKSMTKNENLSSQTAIDDNEDSSPAIIYIPDLPADKSDTDLEQAIRSRLQQLYDIQVSKVQCCSHLGVAVIHLHNHKNKTFLVDVLKSISLFPNDHINVTCADKLEVTSYIVLDQNPTPPNINIVAQQWIDLYPSPHRPQFQTLSIQFPNIIKVTSFSIEELQAVTKYRVFQVEDQLAHIYTNVDCSYLEELPYLQPKLDNNRLFCFIATQLKMSDRAYADKDTCQQQADTLFQQIQSLPPAMKELKLKFYIQYNEQSSNALILASNSLHKWISMKFININGQLIFKSVNIASKLIIKPIPTGFSHRLIFDHPLFKNSIKEDIAKLSGECLVVEVNDKCVYDECLKRRVFEVNFNGDRLPLRILPYTTPDDPDNTEINVQHWYGTKMFNFKPDITQFDSHHPIFRYKWNSKIWLDQFMKNKTKSEGIRDENERRQNDFIQRMLRVTVMLNTMAAVRKHKFILEDSSTKSEVLIEHDSPLVTIVYNHQSKLTKIGETSTPPYSCTTVRVVNEDCIISYNTLVSSGMKPVLLNMANAKTPGGGYQKGDGAQEENIFRRSNYYRSLDYKLDQEQIQSTNNIRKYCSPTGQVVPFDVHQSLYPIDEYGAIYKVRTIQNLSTLHF
ncbi:unnamed protein product [Rotaria sp. Silwood1]|nr:unnamed protein product [Rotaria sp. Silwood1]